MAERYYTLESLEAHSSVGFLIKRCGILMTQFAERRFESEPITFTQWMILMWLTQRPHASPTELSAHLGHDMGALTRVVDELEREALVRRERSEHDRRAVQIAVTPEGRRMAHAGKRVMLDLVNQLVEPLSRTETDALISVLQRLLLHLQEVGKPATPAEPASAAPRQRGKRGVKRAGASRSRKARKQLRRKSLE
jgi:DNA-binding MarR family transcriptional regulator